jgi:hypothetical protein
MRQPPLIGIVGACASGKSTLIRQLSALGFHCRHIAQEHSYVPDMWKQLTQPDILVYLEVLYETTLKRKKLNWTREEFQVQLDRLQNARAHADLIVQTDALTPEGLTDQVVNGIESLLNNFSR